MLQRFETKTPWVQEAATEVVDGYIPEEEEDGDDDDNSTTGLTGSLRFLTIVHHAISSIGACCNDGGIFLETLLTAANSLPPVWLC